MSEPIRIDRYRHVCTSPLASFDEAKPTAAPKLKVKGAEARYMLKCIYWILTNILKPKNAHENLRYDCLKSIYLMYEAMTNWVSESVANVQKFGFQFLQLYGELNANTKDAIYWRIYPKFHLLVHWLLELPKWGHPFRSWTYADESKIGELVKIAPSLHVKHVQKTLMEKLQIP